jgi:hypothetical protein
LGVNKNVIYGAAGYGVFEIINHGVLGAAERMPPEMSENLWTETEYPFRSGLELQLWGQSKRGSPYQ